MPQSRDRPMANAALLVLAGLVAGSLSAQAPDLTGTWDLQASVFFGKGKGADCQFEGSAEIVQTGSEVTGSASLDLTAGDPLCPATMSATLSGTASEAEGILLTGLLSGQLGAVSFSGAPLSADELQGDHLSTQGPFAGSSGTWAAQRQPEQSALEIPTLTAFGLAALVVLLLAAGAVVLLRRRPA